MKIRSFYLRDDTEEQAVKAFIKSLRTGKPIKVIEQQERLTAYTMPDNKPITQIFDVKPGFTIPILPEWEQYQQYPWVFEQARNALIRDFDGQTVTMDVIKKYVEERLKLIDN